MNLEQIFGSGDMLTPLQMAARAFIMFFITLILIRIGGLRIFGKRTAFDNVLVIMLGAVLSRGVVGASPFLATVAAGIVFIFIHKVLGWLAIKFHWVGRLIKGDNYSLYKDGKFNFKNMDKTQISEHDIMEGVRLKINSNELKDVEEAFLERNGEISVVEKT